MISKNKVSKYFFYAFGEIILVVIGILIALQFNSNKELESNKEQTEKILVNVYRDLEKDLISTINLQIKLYEEKDSLAKKVLSKGLKRSDYILDKRGNNPYLKLIENQVEPYRFETNAYNRLIANIEIIPDLYIPLVEYLQDVYGDEAIVTNDVLLEEKVFLEKILNNYQANHAWYSNTEDNHYDEKVSYLLNDKQHLNDVRRYLDIINHLTDHLKNLKQKASLAYNLIHSRLALDLKKSNFIDHIDFATVEELEEYTGIYKDETTGFALEFITDQMTLVILQDRSTVFKIAEDEFKTVNSHKVSFKFKRNPSGKVSSLLVTIPSENGSTRTMNLMKQE